MLPASAQIDGIGAGLAALVLRLELAAAQVERDPAGARAVLIELRDQTTSMVVEARGLAASLARSPADGS